MCLPRKKASGSKKAAKSSKKKSGKQQKSSLSQPSSAHTPSTPKKGESPAKKEEKEEKAPNKEQEQEINPVEENPGENILAKPCADAALKKEKPKEPLHIKVPPPRIIKARRPMNQKRSATDPEYKTLELDTSEWESVKIMKRSEIKDEDIEKKEFKSNVPRRRAAVEVAA